MSLLGFSVNSIILIYLIEFVQKIRILVVFIRGFRTGHFNHRDLYGFGIGLRFFLNSNVSHILGWHYTIVIYIRKSKANIFY